MPLLHHLRLLVFRPAGDRAVADPRDDRIRARLHSQVNGQLGALRLRDRLHHRHPRRRRFHHVLGNHVAAEFILGGVGDGDGGGQAKAVCKHDLLPNCNALHVGMLGLRANEHACARVITDEKWQRH